MFHRWYLTTPPPIPIEMETLNISEMPFYYFISLINLIKAHNKQKITIMKEIDKTGIEIVID